MSRQAPDDDDDDDEFSDDEGDETMFNDNQGGRGGGGRGDDDDFEFEDSMADNSPYPGDRGAQNATTVSNKPYDEAVELSESEPGDSPKSSATPGYSGGGGRGGGGGSSRRQAGEAQISNQPFDEAHELTDEGSVDDDEEGESEDDDTPLRVVDRDSANPPSAAMQQQMAQSGRNFGSMQAPQGDDSGSDDDEGGGGGGGGRPQQPHQSQRRAEAPNLGSLPKPSIGGDDDEGEFSGGGGEGGEQPIAEGMYDPNEYASLNVSAEITELFQYITRYKPHNIELETKMRPFIPEYIPAVGDMDPFIKVPRPDGKADNLGLVSLDEPASIQSDPTVLTLQLRAVSKSSGAGAPLLVRSIEHAEKDPKAINNWISSISDLHRHKPAPSVRYSKPMPDIEALMQIWPAPIEELLEQNPLPDADINLDLASYVRVVCSMLDIPVYDSLTQSLHVLFTLYSDFKANVHFQQQLANEGEEQGGQMGGFGGGYGGGETLDLS